MFYILWGNNSTGSTPAISITELMRDVSTKPSPVAKVQVSNDTDLVVINYTNGVQKVSRRELGASAFITQLSAAGYDPATGPEIEVVTTSGSNDLLNILGWILPFLLIGGVLYFVLRRSAQGGLNQAMSFGKSRARRFEGTKVNITFADVAGVEESKQELAEVVEFLKFPDKFLALGAHIPKGVLLIGPPGTGKTLISKAVAGEAGVPFFSISGSEFVEMFAGVGASRVRDLFEEAKKASPCIIFIDEIDAVGRKRGPSLSGGNGEREQTLNQMLVEMDGFDSNTNIVLIAATNRPDVLDAALLRPGRFDRQVILDLPDMRGRLEILEVHGKGKPFEKEVKLETIARQTIGFSGADLANVLNEAAILAARRNRHTISSSELDEAVLRVLAGPERPSRVVTEQSKLITAYHEVGHALVARSLGNVDPVHKISIIARGRAGGMTIILPSEDRTLKTKTQFEEQIAWKLGGRAAEEIMFMEYTSGASDDIEQVSQLARSMVTQYGMSKRLGPITFKSAEHLTFMGGGMDSNTGYSEGLAYEIDREIQSIINKGYLLAHEILQAHRHKLIEIAELLMLKETVEGAEFERMFDEARPTPLLT